MRSLNLEERSDWEEWLKTSAKPYDIPEKPHKVYKEWQGWGDFLGSYKIWNRNSIASFLRSIIPISKDLQPAEFYAIIRQNGLLAVSKAKANRNGNVQFIKDIQSLGSSSELDTDLEKIVTSIEE